jgi:hypothetical protein
MKDPARASLLIFGMTLLFISPHIRPEHLGTARFLAVIAIGAVTTLAAVLSPASWSKRG